ncbi:YihY/virulence factor BrkB family protein [Streptomyces sp. B6B3]|uniref:YihY/virulence factor BrkB family protein n=1 Tax=Streptomyces sp. B6B3 TaxID=3153570 RepID=UPI00325ED3D9
MLGWGGRLGRLIRVPQVIASGRRGVERFQRSRPGVLYQHLEDRKWERLAAAITFTSFIALFPALALTAAWGAALLTTEQLAEVRRWFADQVPGISDELNLAELFENSETVGLVALVLVLPTGLGWVDAMRGCLRTLWDLPDPEENVLLRRLRDLGVLAGVGAVTLFSLGSSALAMTVVYGATSWVGVTRDGVGAVLLQTAAYLLAVVATFLVLVYLLVWLPGVRPPRGTVITACVLGAVGFELLKALLGGYLTGVAARSFYGAFGAPIALLIWINLVARLLLVCCAWTATAVPSRERPRVDALDGTE